LICLNDIVGLSETECSCYDTDKPEGFDTSLSGYFIDDHEYGVPLAFVGDDTDCEDGGVWDMLTKAKADGIESFIIDYHTFLGKYTKEKHRKFRGRVCIDGNKIHSSAFNTSGLKLYSQGHKGTRFKITSIGLKLDSSETVVIDVAGTSVSIDTTANTISRSDTITGSNPITLDLTDGLGRPVDNLISYTSTGKPYKTKIYCNCSGKMPPFENFAQVRGFGIDGAEPEDSELKKNEAYGLIIDGVFECDALSWLCDDDIDFTTNPHAKVMARTLQLSQINSFLKNILSQTKVNRYTILEPENIAAKVEQNYMLIKRNFEWFVENLPYDLQSCYACRPSGRRRFLRV